MLRNIGSTGNCQTVSSMHAGATLQPEDFQPSDNTGEEVGVNTQFTLKLPMALFLDKLCVSTATTGIQLDVSHIGVKSNKLDTAISRWNSMKIDHPVWSWHIGLGFT